MQMVHQCGSPAAALFASVQAAIPEGHRVAVTLSAQEPLGLTASCMKSHVSLSVVSVSGSQTKTGSGLWAVVAL